MRITLLALAALLVASPAFAQARPSPQVPTPPQTLEENEDGGSGYLPGAQFQRRLVGGPGFVCSATNALHDQQCTASCQAHQTANCIDAEGSGTPSCDCVKE